ISRRTACRVEPSAVRVPSAGTVLVILAHLLEGRPGRFPRREPACSGPTSVRLIGSVCVLPDHHACCGAPGTPSGTPRGRVPGTPRGLVLGAVGGPVPGVTWR